MSKGPSWPWLEGTAIESQELLAVGVTDQMREAMARDITGRREEIAASALLTLEAVVQCGQVGIVLPQWLHRALLERLHPVREARVRSWDDPRAFGLPHPKGAHVGFLQKKREFGWRVLIAASRMIEAGAAIDDLLFAAVAEELGNRPGLGASVVKRLFYAESRQQRRAMMASTKNTKIGTRQRRK